MYRDRGMGKEKGDTLFRYRLTFIAFAVVHVSFAPVSL